MPGVLSHKYAAFQSFPNLSMQGAFRREWQALAKEGNVAVAGLGRNPPGRGIFEHSGVASRRCALSTYRSKRLGLQQKCPRR